MSYQVLARRWRPRNFAQVVGQEHVLRPLINALDGDRLHHAFLFTGTRGVGKTTLARILAKSVNCEAQQGMTSTPCGSCSSCREIDEGRFVDLIEVDAASRTKVEDTRDLLENVQFLPTRGRYKVYLIDEVHMLTKHSFNALLKTLEEPPPHVKFLLATTDPQKLPATILSRCLQFGLRRLTQEQIRGHLAFLLQQEGVASEEQALWELAHAADGSMRDGLSLLDQAIAYGGGAVHSADVVAMLGTIDRSRIVQLIERLVANDGVALLDEIDLIAQQGASFETVLQALIHALQQIALYQAVPTLERHRFGEEQALQALAQRLGREEVQLYYQIGLTGLRDLPLAPDGRCGFEMVLLRMLAFRPEAAAGNPIPPSSTTAFTPQSKPEQKRAKPLESAADSVAHEVVNTTTEVPVKRERNSVPHSNSSAVAKGARGSGSLPPVRDRHPHPSDEPPPLFESEFDAAASLESLAQQMPDYETDELGYEPPHAIPLRVERPAVPRTSRPVTPPAPRPASVAPPATIGNRERATLASLSPVSIPTVVALPEEGSPELEQLWRQWVSAMPLQPMVRQLAENCILALYEDSHVAVRLDPGFGHLRSPMREQRLQEALSLYLAQAITLQIADNQPVAGANTPAKIRQHEQQQRQQQAEHSITEDASVQFLITHMGAKVVDESIHPWSET